MGGPVKIAAAGEVNDRGNVAGRFRVSNVGGHAQYEARVGDQGLKHIGEVVMPAKLQEGTSQLYGRIMQSKHEHNGQPRLQLGLRVRISLLTVVMIWFTLRRQDRRRPTMMLGHCASRWRHHMELASNGSAGNLMVNC